MGKTRNRTFARGCGRNPAGLGLKWVKPSEKERPLVAKAMKAREKTVTVTLRNGKTLTIERNLAEQCIGLFDACREIQFEKNQERGSEEY